MRVKAEELARMLGEAQNSFLKKKPVKWEERSDHDQQGLFATAHYLLANLHIEKRESAAHGA